MASSPSGPPVKTAACPCVADLLDYALGSAGPDERQRVETHIQGTSCSYCRSWIARAGEPAKGEAATAAKWQRRPAFDDLEHRLAELEES